MEAATHSKRLGLDFVSPLPKKPAAARPPPSARRISGDNDDLQDRPSLFLRPVRFRSLPSYIHRLLTTHILTPSLLPAIFSTIRTNLFPHNALPPPAPEPPTPEQQLLIKRHCAETLAALLPDILARAAGLTRDDVVREVETELEVWGDAYLNKHLAYQIIELVVVRLMPEMGEKGLKELMEARGIGI
ncbi:MAG: hypothetical protein Q9219_001298 [cf. Caloplaca sp. 3 TL-2023]